MPVEARQPVFQGLDVVQAQIFHVEHGESARLENSHHLLQGGRVTAGEDAFLDPCIHPLRPVATDGVNQAAPGLRKAAVNYLAEFLIIVRPHVFQHANGNKDVILARDITVVVLDVFNLFSQPLGLGALAGINNLFVGDVVGTDFDAVVPGHVARQSAPPAAGLDHAFAGPQPEFAAHMVHFGELRLLQRHVRRGKIGAGVLHFLIQPQPVERVACVVMAVNVVARSGEGVDARTTVEQLCLNFIKEPELGGGRCPAVDGLNRSNQITVDVDAPGAVKVAEMEVRIPEEFKQRTAIAKLNP